MQKYKELRGFKLSSTNTKDKTELSTNELLRKLKILKDFRSTFKEHSIPKILYPKLRSEYSNLAWENFANESK